jgi:hypothetical protein
LADPLRLLTSPSPRSLLLLLLRLGEFVGFVAMRQLCILGNVSGMALAALWDMEDKLITEILWVGRRTLTTRLRIFQ